MQKYYFVTIPLEPGTSRQLCCLLVRNRTDALGEANKTTIRVHMKQNARSDAAMRDYLSGHFTFRQLAHRYNVTQPTVSYWRRKAALPAPRRGRPKLTTPTAKHMRVLGLAARFPMEEVAWRCGISCQRVYAICKRWQNLGQLKILEAGGSACKGRVRKETRNHVVSFRLTDWELLELQRRSTNLKRSANETARMLLLKLLTGRDNKQSQPGQSSDMGAIP